MRATRYDSNLMTRFRLKQIAIVLLLMASLLSASPAACICSHHEEKAAVETDCHSQHDQTETAPTVTPGDSIDESCVCVVGQREPVAASRSANKELKAFDAVSESEQVIGVPEFVAVTIRVTSTTGPASENFYSNTLRSLLPARAPPRL